MVGAAKPLARPFILAPVDPWYVMPYKHFQPKNMMINPIATMTSNNSMKNIEDTVGRSCKLHVIITFSEPLNWDRDVRFYMFVLIERCTN